MYHLYLDDTILNVYLETYFFHSIYFRELTTHTQTHTHTGVVKCLSIAVLNSMLWIHYILYIYSSPDVLMFRLFLGIFGYTNAAAVSLLSSSPCACGSGNPAITSLGALFGSAVLFTN